MSETMVERLARKWHEEHNPYDDGSIEARWWLNAIAEELGLTREDVEVLRIIATVTLDRGNLEPHSNPMAAARFRDLADRIEALLPPEPSP